MTHSHDQAPRPSNSRQPARSRVIRDLTADWQRWTPAERLSAGVLMAAMWLSLAAFYLSKILQGG